MGNVLNSKKELKLILVAARNQLSSGDIKSLIAYLESDDCEFEISLQISEPTEQPELLELHRLVAIPALIKYPQRQNKYLQEEYFFSCKMVTKMEPEGLTKNLGINCNHQKLIQ